MTNTARILGTLLLTCSVVSPITAQSSRPIDPVVTAMRKHIPNFRQVAPGIYRGAQPSDEAIEALAAAGVKTVINFREFHSERRRVEAAGMKMIEMPLTAGIFGSIAPTTKEIDKFLEVLEDEDMHPIYVHCAHGKDRTGTMVAIYRIEVEGWTSDAAIREMISLGYHRIYKDLIRSVRSYRRRRTPEPVPTENPTTRSTSRPSECER